LCLFGWKGSCYTEHGVGFSASSLTICKNCSIVSIENILNQRKWRLFVDLLLSGILTEYIVIGKMFDSGIDGCDFFKSDLMSDFINDDHILTVYLIIEKHLFRFISDSWDGIAPWPLQIQSYSNFFTLFTVILMI
jgi:hypothetical protein